jgi:hypothetical protein
MVVNSEIKKRTDGNIRVVLYNEDESSSGHLFDKRALYDLYSKLRDVFESDSNEKDVS